MRFMLSLGALLSGLVASVAAAATAPEIQAIRDNAFRADTQMLMYVALDKARERRVAVDKAMATVEKGLASINDPALVNRWQLTRTALSTSPYHDTGEVNQLILYRWENETMAFLAELDSHMPRDLSRQKKELYELVTRMQLMTLIYLRNQTDPLGGNNYIGVNNVELSDLSSAFTKRLNEVMKTNPALKAKLHPVSAKWAFLSKHVASRTSNVPFIVDRYGHQIVDMLLVIANAG
jgi:hypothetical protein